MYQSIPTETRATPAQGRPRRAVETIMGYDGPDRRAPANSPTPPAITPATIIGWLLRFWYLVVALAVVGAIAGLAAGTLIKPRFTSYSDMLLDPSSLQVVADDLYARNVQGDAQLLDVESKMRVLTSNNVLTSVVNTLNLADSADLMEPDFSLSSLFGSDAASGDKVTAAVRALGERVRVRREERSYVVTASVWAHTPEQSAILTDALVQAFLAELAKADSDGALNASTALNERLDQLRDDAAAAEAAVAEYRRANNLQMVGNEQLSTQSAVQLNTQIATARESVIAAEARYANLTASGAGQMNAAAQESTLLSDLRTQYATVRQQADSLGMTLGPRHPSLVVARSQLASIQSEIDREVARVVQTAGTDLERARSVLEQLNQAASTQMGAVFNDDNAQVELRQLERTSASKVAIYEAYLTRAQEITQRSQLDTTNVRVISAAVPPIARNYPPRTVLLIAGGLIGGLALGAMLAGLLGIWPRVRQVLTRDA
ncbi:GumC family protein [Devosia sp. 2618]|uniref:GumC family protein n=1 Tax=Devosia sp. 2618 TaxID=3156454 RepID=UPI00339A337F